MGTVNVRTSVTPISAGAVLAVFLENNPPIVSPDCDLIKDRSPSGLLARFCLTIAAYQLLQVFVPVVLVIVYTTKVRCQAQQRAAGWTSQEPGLHPAF